MARTTEAVDLRVLPDRFSVCRLSVGAELPEWATLGSLLAACWTAEETSIVCPDSAVPTDVQAETGWRALRVAGTLDFAMAGVLLSLLQPLAEAEISVFALSTYDTDYVLVREADLERARNALLSAGHRVK